MKKIIAIIIFFLVVYFPLYSQPLEECNYDIIIPEQSITFSIYNNLAADLTKRINIGGEIYFNKSSFFIEGSFSNTTFFGKQYDIDAFHTGIRKYFNDEYDNVFIEGYFRTIYFNTDLFTKDLNYGFVWGTGIGIGYKITLKHKWKITPMIRIGYDMIYYNNYLNDNGNINISFGDYIDGKKNEKINDNSSIKMVYDKPKINDDFFIDCHNSFWIGPTYFGIIIQKDFNIKK